MNNIDFDSREEICDKIRDILRGCGLSTYTLDFASYLFVVCSLAELQQIYKLLLKDFPH